MTPLVVERELKVSKTIDRRMSRNSTNGRANLVLQRDMLVPGSLRDEIRTLQVKRPKLVRHDRLVRIPHRLREKNKQAVNLTVQGT